LREDFARNEENNFIDVLWVLDTLVLSGYATYLVIAVCASLFAASVSVTLDASISVYHNGERHHNYHNGLL
jgi:hypothetical protein